MLLEIITKWENQWITYATKYNIIPFILNLHPYRYVNELKKLFSASAHNDVHSSMIIWNFAEAIYFKVKTEKVKIKCKFDN